MTTDELSQQLVAILGFGQEGQAVARYLSRHNVPFTVFDARPLDKWPEEERRTITEGGFPFIFGPHYLEELKGFNVAFRSPGIRPLHPRLIEERERGLVVTSQVQWFFEHSPASITGVTGTKGKGTTASLIYEMHKRHASPGTAVYLTGNIGKEQPLDFLETLNPEDIIVYELSSFQLQDLTVSPHVGVVLMVTSEHLDYHESLNEYHTAKAPILAFQKAGDVAVVNDDFEPSRLLARDSAATIVKYSRSHEVEHGCFIKNGMMVAKGLREWGVNDGPFLAISEIALRGAHNQENICAATLAALAANIPATDIQDVIRSFKGLEHRLEPVAERQGIVFYNDSFSTTPETTIAALRSFTEPVILIVGGSEKNSDFTELGREIAAAQNLKAIIAIGVTAPAILQSVAAAGGSPATILENARSMDEVFTQIRSIATKGDVVVLSPASASFDMFKNYKERGNQFKAHALAY